MARARFYDVSTDPAGRPVAGVTVDVYTTGTTTPLPVTIYAAATGGATRTNPFVTTTGVVDFFLEDPATVDLKYTRVGYGTQTQTVEVVEATPPATAVTVTPVGNLAATTAQAAFAELDAETSDRVRGTVRLTVAADAPSSPATNDMWVDSDAISTLEHTHTGTLVRLATADEITAKHAFRGGFTSRTVGGDTGFGAISMRAVGELSSGTIDWIHNGDYGYLVHLTTGANLHRPYACIGIGSDTDANGLLLSNKGTGNGMFGDNQATVTSATGAGHVIHGKQSSTDASASCVYLQAAVDGAGPLLVLDMPSGTPTAGQILAAFTGPSSTLFGQIKALDGTLDWRAPISTTGAMTVGGALGVTGNLTAVNVTTTGTLQSSGTFQVVKTTATAQALISASAGQARELSFQTGGSSRWTIRTDTTGETGSNAGSDLTIVARTDAGATLSTPLKITRSTGLITLTGTLLTAVSATGGAGLRVPHGAAPTSPVDGDVWTTTAGMFVRVNGATVGPLS
jgi:hypothetical protein